MHAFEYAVEFPPPGKWEREGLKTKIDFED